MNEPSFLALVQNIALLLALALIIEASLQTRPKNDCNGSRWQEWMRQASIGFLLGAIGIAIMLTPWVYSPGIIFDTLSVLLGISGLFFGIIPTLIAMAILAFLRISLGGAATWMGVAVIVESGTIGIIWRHFRRKSLVETGWPELYLFGLGIHLVMLACTFILPMATATQVFANIYAPVLVIYPVGTVLLGMLMVNRLRREKIQEVLTQTTARLNSAQRLTKMGAWEWFASPPSIYWTDEVYRIYGFSSAEFHPGSMEHLQKSNLCFDPADRPIIMAAFQTCCEKGVPYDLEFPITRLRGERIWIRSVAEALVEQGKIARVVGNITNITDRKRDELEREALLEILQGLVVTKDLQEILALVHHSVGKIISAENLYVVFLNQESGLFEEIYGVDKYDAPFLPFRLEKSITAYVFRSGKALILTQARFHELEALGEVELVGTNFASWLGAPLITPEGTIGVIAVQDYETQDRYSERDKDFLAQIGAQVGLAIERNTTEEALKTREKRLFSILNGTKDSACLVDTQGRYLVVNDALVKSLGKSVPETLGMSFIETEDREIWEKRLGYLNEVIESGKALEFEDSRKSRFFHVRYWPVLSMDGIVESVAVFANEITDRKRAEEKIQADQIELKHLLVEAERSQRTLLSVVEDQKEAEDQVRLLNAQLEQRVKERTALLSAANQELESFSYSVSHDLRAPLRGLDGFSSVLLQDYAGVLDEQGQHYLTRIKEASHRMGELIDDLLSLSQVTRRGVDFTNVDLSAAARKVFNELQSEAPQHQVEIEIAGGMIVRADPNLMVIALENLLSNALKFTGKEELARIQVGVLEQPGAEGRVFFVRDNGAGFDMAYADKLFTPFQRLHGANEYAGTGIGLTIVQRIITRHGGRIWCEAGVNQGATFYFTLGVE